MIFSPVRAIAIDNNGLELVSIVNGLAAQGVPCSAHLYDMGDLVPAPPSGGYKHLRLAFVDVNLQDSIGLEVKNLASVITAALKKVVATGCGPYALIFWTSFPETVEALKPEILRQFGQQGVPAPSLITHLGKADLIPLTNAKEADHLVVGLRTHFVEQAELGGKLGTSLEAALRQSGAVSVVSAWETMLSEAASDTLTDLYIEAKGIPEKEPSAAFVDVLSTIAVEAIGQKNARDDPLTGLTEGLLELVVDNLRSATSSATAEEIVKAELFSRIKDGPAALPAATVAQINRLFQVELLDGGKPISRISRGLVLRPGESFLQTAGLAEPWESFVWRELLHDPNRMKRSDPQRESLLARRSEVAARVKPLIIEVGADCDHAQRKPRSHRFLLAAEVPNDCVEEFLASGDASRRSPYVSDAIEVFGPWAFSGDMASVAVCCKRFLSLQTDNIPPDCEAVMRIRSALVNHLLHRYSTLSTRPGFISLRHGA